MSHLFEAVGNMHMHTPYSDGEKWHADIANEAIAAGLDFIIVTDHNVWVNGVEGWYENENGRVLLLSGEEVHNVRRRPQASHLLVYGAEKELAPYAHDPQQLINEAQAAGGYTFLAHPFERELRILPHGDLGWHDWPLENFTGLEIWNYMSSMASQVADKLDRLPVQVDVIDKLYAVWLAGRPEQIVVGPDPKTLDFWDKLLSEGKRVTAVGNSDAHGTQAQYGPFKRVIYPYEHCFRAVNTHLLLPKPFTGALDHDKRLLLQAIGQGHSWVGYDLSHPTKGFRFSGQGIDKGIMGHRVRLDAGATLQVKTPAKANIRLIRHGEVVAQVEEDTHLTYLPIQPGAYRVECTRYFESTERGWIYSNPIYLK
ncbi:MAG: CehA/McbA family metallohydrolase [Chloroflexota bacterium]